MRLTHNFFQISRFSVVAQQTHCTPLQSDPPQRHYRCIKQREMAVDDKASATIQALFVEFAIFVLCQILTLAGHIIEHLKPLLPTKNLEVSKKKHVVVVGASFAGCKTEQILAEHGTVDITLIDTKPYFEYVPGALRCFVDPKHFTNSLSAPLSTLTSTTTKVVTATVANIVAAKQEVELESGITVKYDYLVLCAGSAYSSPIKPKSAMASADERQKEWEVAAQAVTDASTIVIVGAGAVGVELAAEILTVYRSKTLYLFDVAPTILPGFPSSSVSYATKWLEQRGAQLRLGCSLQTIGYDYVQLADGTKLEADIVYRCMGSPPNTEFLKRSDLRDALKGPKGSVVVNDHLQVLGHENIYCAGDMMFHPGSKEVKLGHTAEVNGHLCAENILLAASGQKPELQYPQDVVGNSVTPFIYCISLGKYDATLGFNDLVLNGPPFAVVKWILEWSKVMMMQRKLIGVWFWIFGDFVSNLLGRTLLRRKTKKKDE